MMWATTAWLTAWVTMRPSGFGLAISRSVQSGSAPLRIVVNGTEGQNLHLPFAIGSDKDGGFSDFLVEQGTADGRRGRNPPGGDVGLLAGHQLVFDFLILGIVEDLYGGTQSHFVAGDVVHVDHGE